MIKTVDYKGQVHIVKNVQKEQIRVLSLPGVYTTILTK